MGQKWGESVGRSGVDIHRNWLSIKLILRFFLSPSPSGHASSNLPFRWSDKLFNQNSSTSGFYSEFPAVCGCDAFTACLTQYFALLSGWLPDCYYLRLIYEAGLDIVLMYIRAHLAAEFLLPSPWPRQTVTALSPTLNIWTRLLISL